MAVHDDDNKPRVDRGDALGNLGRRELVRLGIDDLYFVALLPNEVAINPAHTGFSTAVRRVPRD
jgi:hypothetical protein